MPASYRHLVHLSLRYFIDYFPDHAGFVDLVLQKNDKKYIQKVDIDGIVLGFEEIDLEGSIHLADLSGKREARIGQQAWCGFRTKDSNIIIRQWQDMQDYLRENFVHYSDMVFLSYDIAEFLGDEDKQVACAEPIIKNQDLFHVSSRLTHEYKKGK